MPNSSASGPIAARHASTPSGPRGEVDAHEEDALVRITELLAVEDVAAPVRDRPGDGVDDPAPIRA